jgi:hypothetical protein
MTKRLIIFLVLAALVPLIGQTLGYLFGEDLNRSPAYFSVYPDSGYYEIDPTTILERLNHGETNVFTPFFGDWDREEPYYDSITWTQSDYLKIANALSLETWKEPLDLKGWDVLMIDLQRSCDDNPHGFDTFSITYYKSMGIKNWERQYTTRLIEVYSWKGIIRWGSNAVFSTPLLLGWDGFDLTQFKIMADDALPIAEENGGRDVRRKVDNSCWILLTANQLSPLPHGVNWLVDYERADFYMHINPYSGKP